MSEDNRDWPGDAPGADGGGGGALWGGGQSRPTH